MIIAVDHPARRILRVGDRPYAMANRRLLLENTIRALRRPGVDGLLASPDVLEDLLLLGRTGQQGSVRIDEPGRPDRLDLGVGRPFHRPRCPRPLPVWDSTAERCFFGLTTRTPAPSKRSKAARGPSADLAERGLIALIEPLPAFRDDQGTGPDIRRHRPSGRGGRGRLGAGTHLRLHVAQAAGPVRSGEDDGRDHSSGPPARRRPRRSGGRDGREMAPGHEDPQCPGAWWRGDR